MFSKNSTVKIVYSYKSGILKFKFPYLNTNKIADEKTNEIAMDYCNVEIHMTKNELNDQRMVTVFLIEAKESYSVTNFVEHIATNIRNTYIKPMFVNYEEISEYLTNDIKWIQVDYYPELGAMEVDMHWDEKRHRYNSPAWNTCDEAAILDYIGTKKEKY
ncbi:hypothetical protein [Metabacillus endolithicus]|uniref:Uncharacterized protein n=1 Tax=Metabacillus endolithicus TaxID=1535204 RepID=A0ABW5C578_9BACI|nr:hypothetical protein [Metabacillus endolithicus]UPG66266.1 hypothetical protein MVE64_26530 [Metabacillus endolithicus]